MQNIIPTQNEEVLSNNRFHKSWFIFLHDIYKSLGEGRKVNTGGILNLSTEEVGNITTGEDDLMSYTLEKNILKYDNEVVEVKAYGIFGANANNKTIKLYLGSTEIFDTGANAINGGSFIIKATIIRKSATTQDIIIESTGTDTNIITSYYTTSAEDLTTNLIVKLTGEATSTDDIIQKGMMISLLLNN